VFFLRKKEIGNLAKPFDKTLFIFYLLYALGVDVLAIENFVGTKEDAVGVVSK
jgi:hypothetical protein